MIAEVIAVCAAVGWLAWKCIHGVLAGEQGEWERLQITRAANAARREYLGDIRERSGRCRDCGSVPGHADWTCRCRCESTRSKHCKCGRVAVGWCPTCETTGLALMPIPGPPRRMLG